MSSGLDSKEVVSSLKMIDTHGEIHLRCGKSEIIMTQDGNITIKVFKLNVSQEDGIVMNAARIDLN